MITLTREEAQQLLEVFELFLEEAEDVTTLEDNLVKMLRARLSAPEPKELTGKEKIVYDILCSDETPPNGQHWEGFVAQKIVEALAQPEPEPHGYLWFTQYMEQRFTHRKPEERERIGDVKPLYTAPPQREWQGLTDEEIRNEANHHVFDESFFNGAVWARGKIKEKNRG
jgi:hypothetical protein